MGPRGLVKRATEEDSRCGGHRLSPPRINGASFSQCRSQRMADPNPGRLGCGTSERARPLQPGLRLEYANHLIRVIGYLHDLVVVPRRRTRAENDSREGESGSPRAGSLRSGRPTSAVGAAFMIVAWLVAVGLVARLLRSLLGGELAGSTAYGCWRGRHRDTGVVISDMARQFQRSGRPCWPRD
jgi:hypothetical protein